MCVIGTHVCEKGEDYDIINSDVCLLTCFCFLMYFERPMEDKRVNFCKGNCPAFPEPMLSFIIFILSDIQQ